MTFVDLLVTAMSAVLDRAPDQPACGPLFGGTTMALVNMIRYLRYQAGEMILSQKELADRVEVSRQTINAIERSKHQPSLELAFRIAGAFDKPLEEVFLFLPDVEFDYESLEPVVIEVSWGEPVP